jgi:phosphoglycolate phosphatase-like HAD superfamily hydrolase
VARGILLDLDGTITDSSALMAHAVASAMRARGIEPPEESELIDLVRSDSPIAILRRAGVPLAIYWNAYAANAHRSTPIVGIDAAIAGAAARGVGLGVVTSLPHPAATSLLSSMRLLSCFSSVVTYGSTHRHKPYGDPVVAGVVELGLTPTDCVYIGDQPADIEAGKAAGVGTVAVLWGFGKEWDLRTEEPDVVLAHPQELIDFISQF